MDKIVKYKINIKTKKQLFIQSNASRIDNLFRKRNN